MKALKIAGIFAVVAFALTVVSANAAFTRSLTLGSTGADVTELQTLLISKGFVIPAGATGYFGAQTQSALAKFQAANGISPAAGYFGPITMAKVASMGTTPDDSNDSDTDSGDLEGGDGDFKAFDKIDSVDNETLDEGSSEQVFGFEFEADDSDLQVERVNVTFSTTTQEKPWKFFEEVSLFNGDDNVATVDASDEDNWDEGEDDEYEISFDDLSEIVRENDEAKFYIEVTSQDSIDDTDLPIEWTVEMFDEDVRALNAEGRDVYSDGTGASVTSTFDQDVADSSDLDTTLKGSENEDQSIEVDDSTDVTEEVLLYTFTVEAQDGDINIDQVDVTIATSSGTSTVEDILKNVYLFIDGDEVGSESGDTSVSFEDIDFDLSEDDEVTVEVFADVEGTDDGDQYTSGNGVVVEGLTIDYVDSQDDDQTQSDLASTAGGDVTFYTTGINAEIEDENATATYGSFSGDNDRAVFTIVFNVTAFGTEDIYVGGANTTGSSNAGITYTIASSTAGTITKAELTSDAEEGDNNTFVVSAGDTETFTFEVEVSDASTTAADVAQKLTITGIKWDVDDDATPDETYNDNLDDFETASKTI